MSAHESSEDQVNQRISELINEYRERCLWFMKPDFLPETEEERHRVLDLIVRHGDRRAYERVMEIRQWLSQRSSSRS